MIIKNKFLFIIAFVLTLVSCKQSADYEYIEGKAFQNLAKVVANTSRELSDYLQHIEKLAGKIKSDDVMQSFFIAKKNYYSLQKETDLPTGMVQQIEVLKNKIQQHYLLNYLTFYDILFIDVNGDVFYTIRKEKDYHKNIFTGELAETQLSVALRENPGESYVDFQFYLFSGEPSAFFIEPVYEKNEITGWYALQFSVNKINQLFEEQNNLGKTGEVLLVNQEHLLLTNSRFDSHNTILKIKLPDNNIESKFRERKGIKQVIDYRNKTVLSAFEVFEFLNTEWLIIAKKDKAEVVTDFYKENSSKLFPVLLSKISKQTKTNEEFVNQPDVINVQIDEFSRADTNSILFTQGVSTCTAIIISYPGRFAYMAHISPYDKIYGESGTDILGQIIKRIAYYEIPESEKINLEFNIVSTSDKAFYNCINLLNNKGYLLSQIKILYNKNAEYANICHIAEKGETVVNWKIINSENTFKSSVFSEQKSLGELFFD
ncbi:MAG: cache domain-containing protein [Bacteroidales bacterium]|nr:cache domain-containing protein [Bacteroidales bacterium]MBN2817351.1 cache domain-containing protein [Bacteroidales bacterium]